MRRILIISHVYVAPEHRGKLRALAARDLELTVGVPQRWKQPPPGLDHMVETTWERQSGVEIFPIPVGDPGDLLRYRFGRRALAALIRDKRPDLIQVEEEATSAAARPRPRCLSVRPATEPLPFPSRSFPSSACTCLPPPSTSRTRGWRSGAWAAWSQPRESIRCWRRSRRSAVRAGASPSWATARTASASRPWRAGCGWQRGYAGRGHCRRTT